MIISVSGTPGTGKSAAACIAAERLGWELVELNKFAEIKNLYAGYDEERKCKIVDIERMKKEISKISSKNMILESHYAHDMPCDIAVILRTSPGELRRRLLKRGWPKRKIDENAEAEIMEICKSEAIEQGKRVVEIDTTNKTPQKVAEEIVNYARHES